jgi:hypothetical protein
MTTIIEKSLAKDRLEKFLSENEIRVFTEKDFDFPKEEETQAAIRAEVDEFLEMLETNGKEELKLAKERDKWL